MMPLRAGTPHPPQTRHLLLEEKAGGNVSVWDGYKTVIFERGGADVPASEEVIFRRGEVVIRTSGEVEPVEAARLYIEYLELIRSCPRYRTDDGVNCKDRDYLSLRESTPHPQENGPSGSEAARGYREESGGLFDPECDRVATRPPVPTIQMKPKKITFRILEGEKVV